MNEPEKKDYVKWKREDSLQWREFFFLIMCDFSPLTDVLLWITRTHLIVNTYASNIIQQKKSIDLFVNRNIRNDYFASYQVKHNDKNEKNKNFYDEKTWRKRGKKPTKRTNNGPWILFSCRHHVVIIIIKYNDEKKTSRLCCIFILLNIVLVIAKTFIVTTLIEIWVGKKRDREREQQS